MGMLLRGSSEAGRIGSRRNEAEQRRICVALFAFSVRPGERDGSDMARMCAARDDDAGADQSSRTRTMLASMAQNHVPCGSDTDRVTWLPLAALLAYRCGSSTRAGLEALCL